MPKTTPEQNKALVLEAFRHTLQQARRCGGRTIPVAGLHSTQRSDRTWSRWSVQSHQEHPTNVEVRTEQLSEVKTRS